jgi:hypothetical protein
MADDSVSIGQLESLGEQSVPKRIRLGRRATYSVARLPYAIPLCKQHNWHRLGGMDDELRDVRLPLMVMLPPKLQACRLQASKIISIPARVTLLSVVGPTTIDSSS